MSVIKESENISFKFLAGIRNMWIKNFNKSGTLIASYDTMSMKGLNNEPFLMCRLVILTVSSYKPGSD